MIPSHGQSSHADRALRAVPPSLVGRALVVVVAMAVLAWPCAAATLILKDGRSVDGDIAKLSSLINRPDGKEAVIVQPILACDDGLRRIFISTRAVREVSEAPLPEPPERFVVRQTIPRFGSRVAMVGSFARLDPFDAYGRRIVQMNTNQGFITVVQGITEITPKWTKVEAVGIEGKNYLWELRLATSSIPRETLGAILNKQIDPTKIEQRLKIVRLYLQSERYRDAELELEEITRDFPESKEQYASTLVKLRQAYARRALEEVKLRQEAAQHHLVYDLLGKFPTDNVAGETLQTVREMAEDYTLHSSRARQAGERFDAELAKLPTEIREALRALRDEMAAEVNVNTLGRLDTFLQFADDQEMTAEEKVAMAVSGWLVGAKNTTRNLPVAVSLFRVRDKIYTYMATETKIDRMRIIEELRGEEGATPEGVANLLQNMKPPMPLPPEVPGISGLYQGAARMIEGQPPTPYFVQLPPEYDPHRAYPTIISLHGAQTTPLQQIEWWTGGVQPDGTRFGQASRFGYIVIAPAWGRDHQTGYEFSLAEHSAVLNSLRDACRRFSIDTDRVFLSGHSMGADAAWDMGLSHPDLWAGVIPVAATADKYVAVYWPNAKFVPMYFVCGELDGDKLVRNARDFDRYLRAGYNVTVSEFRGRGHENFSDEILNLFDWMGRYKRNFFPTEFSAVSMRTWDTYFWWLDLANLPEKTVVDPSSWPPPRNARPMETTSKLLASSNGIYVRSGAGATTLWLSPEMIDFSRPASITVNGARLRSAGSMVAPDVGVMLEDVRTRGDRQHPFWARVDMPNGEVNMAVR